MEPPHFQAKDSIPRVCGIHATPLVNDVIPIDSSDLHLGPIACYLCPESRKVIAEPAKKN